MSDSGIDRRTFLKSAGRAAVSPVGVARSEEGLATRHRILVDNPETLYGFTKSR